MYSDNSPIIKRAKKYVGIYISAILFIVAFGLGMMADRYILFKHQVVNDEGLVEISKVVNLNRSLNKANSVDFGLFWQIWDKVKKDHVKDDVKETDMFYGALQGMVSSLDDPYSVFFPPKQAQEFAKDLSGEFEGIGAEIGVKQKQLVIVSPLPNSPAQKAGLRPGDKVIAINGTSTLGINIISAVRQIRGKAGTTVVLKIHRDGWEKTKDINIVRAQINIPSFLYALKPGKIAHLRVMEFNQNTRSGFDKYIKKMQADGAKGLVLDLRGNPGGFLISALDVASEWVDTGKVVVSQKGKKDDVSKDLKSKGVARLGNMKTVVLINRGSASASEIVAGALQDYGKAVLIGEQSFGKGSVQDFQPFRDGSALKLTVAEWYTPKGRNINKLGIKPDIEIKEEWDKQAVGEDPILKAAVDLFSSSTYKW